MTHDEVVQSWAVYIAGGGGISVGWLVKYLIDKLANNRNGSGNGKVALTEIRVNQQTCLKNQDATLAALQNIEKYACEQTIYLKMLVENEHKAQG